MGYRVRQNWLLGAKGAKIAVEKQKSPKGIQNQKIRYILAIMTM